ncbi:cytidylyltransferase [Aphelenchoides avenae]|nr:cytidylyltransferase [Aphelenchus avenae]
MSFTGLRGTPVALVACGSFNPPTFMHMRMFERARDFLEKDCGSHVVEGIISPVADTFAKPELISAQHRLKMAELAVSSSSWIRADGWECQKTEWSRTLTVLKHHREELRKKYSSPVRLLLLCGADVVDSFVRILPNGKNLWEPSDVQDIVRDFGIIVLNRTGGTSLETLKSMASLDPTTLANVAVLEDDAFPNEMSSTRLRRAIRAGRSIRYCSPDGVVDYIVQHKLYMSTYI